MAALKIPEAVQPLLTWIRGYLADIVLEICSLGDLDLEDRLTRRRRIILRDIVPEAPPQYQAKTTYVTQAALRAPMPPYPSKEMVTPVESW